MGFTLLINGSQSRLFFKLYIHDVTDVIGYTCERISGGKQQLVIIEYAYIPESNPIVPFRLGEKKVEKPCITASLCL